MRPISPGLWEEGPSAHSRMVTPGVSAPSKAPGGTGSSEQALPQDPCTGGQHLFSLALTSPQSLYWGEPLNTAQCACCSESWGCRGSKVGAQSLPRESFLSQGKGSERWDARQGMGWSAAGATILERRVISSKSPPQEGFLGLECEEEMSHALIF